MTDQERITDFLCSEKKMTANYDSFASECVNIPLRDEFLRLFNQSHHSQTELFQTAQERGPSGPAAVLGRFLPGAVEKQKKIPYNTIC